MTLAAKQRVVVVVLAVLAVWPIAHRALVAHMRLDPWRFFGWAMYCTPKLPVMIQLIAVTGAARVPLAIETLPRQDRRQVYRLSRQRAMWGTFASPDRLGQQVLASQTGLDAIEVVIRHWYLDPATSRIAEARYKHRYARDGTG